MIIDRILLLEIAESSLATPAANATNNQNVNFNRNFSSASPLNTYHNSLRKLKNGERMVLFRNNSLKRSFKKVNNEPYYQPQPHHCTIELKTKATSCLHLFNKTPPMILTTFRNHSDKNDNDDRKKNNEILRRYQFDISKSRTSLSQCNLNHASVQHNYNQANNNANMAMSENKTML